MSSLNKTLYTGVTSDLTRRVQEHKGMERDGFTKRYKITRLVYFEEQSSSAEAIMREKQIKGWRRSKKVELIEESNPSWLDLAADWFV